MILEKKQSVVIVAGGMGYRAGGELPKQFMLIGGKPMLMHSIEAFYNYDPGMHIVVVLPEGFQTIWEQLCREHQFRVEHKVTIGGETRFHSVRNGLEEILKGEMVGVHDAARPFVTPELIARCYDESFQNHCGVIPVVDEVNSIRQLTEKGSRMLDRRRLKIVQTPQVFPADMLKEAYETDYDPSFTDDASVAEKRGVRIRLVPGDKVNIKITTTLDMVVAGYYFQSLARR